VYENPGRAWSPCPPLPTPMALLFEEFFHIKDFRFNVLRLNAMLNTST